jgi:hypothetical protein
MIKRILVVGLFLGGGYLFIKKILPVFTGKEFDFGVESLEDRLARERQEQLEKYGDLQKNVNRTYGVALGQNKRLAIGHFDDIDMDNLTEEQKDSIRKTLEKSNKKYFPNGLTYDPNNLDSFKGLKDWTIQMF